MVGLGASGNQDRRHAAERNAEQGGNERFGPSTIDGARFACQCGRASMVARNQYMRCLAIFIFTAVASFEPSLSPLRSGHIDSQLPIIRLHKNRRSRNILFLVY